VIFTHHPGRAVAAFELPKQKLIKAVSKELKFDGKYIL
jgi:hypothetical protein